MGNAATLPYDIAQQIDYNGSINWTLHEASKKVDREELKENVSLFRVSKTANPNDLALAQKTIQKLRTLKHPFVLRFIDTAEMEDSLALVTESCVPLETWLANTNAQNSKESTETAQHSQEDDPVKLQEILWGFKCILLALNFLHTNCSILHGNLGIHSIFVTPNGDWKLGGFELAGNMSVQTDMDAFVKNAHLLNNYYCSSERLQTEALRAKNPPYYVDMYSFGQCMNKVFALLHLEMPRGFGKYLSAVLHADMRKRPTAQKLCESAMFHSEHLQFIESIGELSLKAPKEFLEVISQMEPKVAGLSRAVCAHKILPNLARTLQIAINDFPLRDAREGCRQSIQVSVNLLSKLASLNKIDPVVFRASWVPILVQLWGMSDRTVRTVMLQSLKALVPFVPDAVVNKSIFDNVLAGFADSNAKLRESTLMSLIFIVDKLDEVQLQDRLVRSITNLQNDAEPSIRTNATIFLGKIAAKLKEAVRVRVLCAAFQKAMKDNFMHCRVAGLRTANACVKLLDAAQMASKLIPQASILLLDKSAEVRSLAFTLIESCLEALRGNHEAMTAKAKAEGGGNNSGSLSAAGTPSKHSDSLFSFSGSGTSAAPGGAARSSSAGSSSAGAGGGEGEASSGSGWSSWSVLQGISKTLESATIVGGIAAADNATGAPLHSAPSNQQHHNSSSASLGLGGGGGDTRKGPSVLKTSASMASTASNDSMMISTTHHLQHHNNFNDADDLDFDPDMHDGDDPRCFDEDQYNVGDDGYAVGSSKKSGGFGPSHKDSFGGNRGQQQQKQQQQGWDDDLDIDVDSGDETPSPPPPKLSFTQAKSPASGGMQLGSLGASSVAGKPATAATAPRGMSLKAPSDKDKTAGKAPKVAVTKLSVSKGEDNWDDF